jgi:hypothetical protein
MLEACSPLKKNGMKAKVLSSADLPNVRTWVQACGLMGKIKEKSYNVNNEDNCLPLCLIFII